MIPVGERVKRALNHAGFSQKELAERAGVTESSAQAPGFIHGV